MLLLLVLLAYSAFSSKTFKSDQANGHHEALSGTAEIPERASQATVLDNGITIRARVDSVDAETLRLIFMVVGFSVNRVVLPSTDNRTYPILEIGNLPR
jgi:hypothetical protein